VEAIMRLVLCGLSAALALVGGGEQIAARAPVPNHLGPKPDPRHERRFPHWSELNQPLADFTETVTFKHWDEEKRAFDGVQRGLLAKRLGREDGSRWFYVKGLTGAPPTVGSVIEDEDGIAYTIRRSWGVAPQPNMQIPLLVAVPE
jgi:hypothetical protein